MLITLSGLDGAGKTTLTDWLRAELENGGGRRVTVLHMNDHVGVYAWLRSVRDAMLCRPRRDGPPRLHRRTSRLGRLRDAVLWSRVLRRMLYPIDVLAFLVIRAWHVSLRREVLIMDRYFYDRLVDVADGAGSVWVRLLARLTPTPDVAVLLTIPPEEAFARKGEYSVPYLRRRDAAYRGLFPLAERSLILPARELDAARELLMRAVRERLDR